MRGSIPPWPTTIHETFMKKCNLYSAGEVSERCNIDAKRAMLLVGTERICRHTINNLEIGITYLIEKIEQDSSEKVFFHGTPKEITGRLQLENATWKVLIPQTPGSLLLEFKGSINTHFNLLDPKGTVDSFAKGYYDLGLSVKELLDQDAIKRLPSAVQEELDLYFGIREFLNLLDPAQELPMLAVPEIGANPPLAQLPEIKMSENVIDINANNPSAIKKLVDSIPDPAILEDQFYVAGLDPELQKLLFRVEVRAGTSVPTFDKSVTLHFYLPAGIPVNDFIQKVSDGLDNTITIKFLDRKGNTVFESEYTVIFCAYSYALDATSNGPVKVALSISV